MTIKARRLKALEEPERTALYEVRAPRDIVVKEEQSDGTLDQVTLEYHIGNDDIGYFAKEYRPVDVQKEGAQVIDITAMILDHKKRCARWHLYDIKDTLAGEHTVVKLYSQWNSGLCYLKKDLLDHIPEYTVIPDLGVITRVYDEKRMVRLKDEYQRRCNQMEDRQSGITLSKRKRQADIAKYRGILRVTQAIIDRNFQTENGNDTYKINIRPLFCENDRVYKMRFPV